jgi:hypothetical protein
MAQALPTLFIDDVAVTAMGVRVPAASLDTGVNRGGGNAPGIGISTENPNLEESLMPNTNASATLGVGSWSLLDQHGDVRTAQISQCLGGPGISDADTSSGQEGTLPDAVARFGANPDNVDGQPDNDAPIVVGAGADLAVLADGWADVV